MLPIWRIIVNPFKNCYYLSLIYCFMEISALKESALTLKNPRETRFRNLKSHKNPSISTEYSILKKFYCFCGECGY